MPTKAELEQEVKDLRAEIDELKKQDSVAANQLAQLEIERLQENEAELIRKNLAWEKRYANVRDRAENFDKLSALFDKLRAKLD